MIHSIFVEPWRNYSARAAHRDSAITTGCIVLMLLAYDHNDPWFWVALGAALVTDAIAWAAVWRALVITPRHL